MKFRQYKTYVETQTSKRLKKVRVDGGGEFINKDFKKFILESGMELEVTVAHSPAQNGISEWLNQTIVEHACTMIIDQNTPKFL